MQKRKLDIVGDFDHATGVFAEWKPSGNFRSIFGRSIIGILNSLKKKSRINVLEAGCGHGTWFGFISKLEFSKKIKYVGIDFSKKRIEAAKKLFRKNKNAKFLSADYLEYQNNRKYDLIFFIEVCQYAGKKAFAKFLEKAKSMLEKGGYIAIIDKERYSAHSAKIFLGKLFKKLPYYYRHVHYPSFSYLEKLAEASGLKQVKRLKVGEFNAIVMQKSGK